MVPVAGWKETQVSDMDFNTIMEKAYEEYFEGLAEGEEASASVSLNRRFPVRQNLTADKRNSTARNQYAETRTRHHRARLYR